MPFVMVAGFHSFFWKRHELVDAELNQALAELMDPTELDAYLRAFTTLLHSGDTAATGIALDHFQYSGALTRFGGESVVEQYASEVLAVARQLLRQPPLPEDEHTLVGANHASALNAMMNIAEPVDAELIAAALERATSVDVRQAACMAARNALAETQPNQRLIAALGAVAFDESLDDVRERADALAALDDVNAPEAAALLIRATESSELEIQTQGAIGLAEPIWFEAHRERVERLVAAWPEDVPYQARWLRDRLTGFHSTYWVGAELENAELRAAHAELMFPTGEDACHRAFRTLLHSDDTVAVGIALDHYGSGQMREFLEWEAVEAYASDVSARAREVLRQPPSPAELSPATGAAANHLSAAETMHTGQLVTASDAGLIADVLEQAGTDRVRHKALWLAWVVFGKSEAPDRRLIDVVSRFAFAPDLATHRHLAVRTLGEGLGPEADPLLVRAVRSDDWDIRVEAARQLADPKRIERHRAFLEELVEGWPARLPAPRLQLLAKSVRTAVFGGMHSRHWEGHRLTDPQLYAAHRELRQTSDEEIYRRAFQTLLRSGDTAAVGIALDHWSHPEGVAKHWGEDAREAYMPEVLDRAHTLLRQPPSSADLSPATGIAANHLSALDVLDMVAPAEVDNALLITTLQHPASDEVRRAAVSAAGSLLHDKEEADRRLIEVLGAIARDEELPVQDRTDVLNALAAAGDSAVAAELARAAACDNLHVQAAAALHLSRENWIDGHRDLLVRLAAGWPEDHDDDAPWEIPFVRERLGLTK